MEKGYTPGCISIVFVLAIGFFIGKFNSGGGSKEVLARLDVIEKRLQQFQSGVATGAIRGVSSQVNLNQDPEDTFRAQKAYQHVEPDWELGVDPNVSAEMGGKGFTGEGWLTSKDYNYLGDPRAQKGGTLRINWFAFPATFRPIGGKSNTIPNRMMRGLMHESLLGTDPLTLEPTPSLATHWKILEEGQVFLFRINPSARWSDGTPFTSEDVKESLRIRLDPGIESPSVSAFFSSRIEKIEALSKYLVKFTFKTKSWRNFQMAYGMDMFPAHILKNLDGAEYLKKFQFKFLPGTGPYKYESHVEGTSLTLVRRKDYWAQEMRSNIGLFNFDRIYCLVIADRNTAFEALKKGDIDAFQFSKAQRWVEETLEGKFANGLIQKRKIFNRNPVGTYGLGYNLRKPPFNDRRVRLAFSHLFDFETMNKKFFFDQYVLMDSYFDNGSYERTNKKEVYRYNPNKAREYLAQAGWDQLNSEGYLTKNGQAFELDITIPSGSKATERIYTKIQQDFLKVGIKLNVIKKSPTEQWKILNDRKFEIIGISWAQNLYPAPEYMWHSKNADQPNTNNCYGVKDPRIDRLIEDYELESDFDKRAQLLQEIDRLLYDEIIPVGLWFYGPYARFGYQYFLNHPSYYLGPYDADVRSIVGSWWVDPQRKRDYDRVLKDGGQLPLGQTDSKYWINRKLN